MTSRWWSRPPTTAGSARGAAVAHGRRPVRWPTRARRAANVAALPRPASSRVPATSREPCRAPRACASRAVHSRRCGAGPCHPAVSVRRFTRSPPECTCSSPLERVDVPSLNLCPRADEPREVPAQSRHGYPPPPHERRDARDERAGSTRVRHEARPPCRGGGSPGTPDSWRVRGREGMAQRNPTAAPRPPLSCSRCSSRPRPRAGGCVSCGGAGAHVHAPVA